MKKPQPPGVVNISNQNNKATLSTEQFATFTASLPEPLCLIDSSGQILVANPAAARIFDAAAQTPGEKNLSELVADDQDRIDSILRTWSRSREATPGPLQIRTPNKQVIPCNCYGSLVQPKSEHAPALILLRIEEREHFTKSFIALNEKIELLQNEIKKHKQTETTLAQRNAEFESMINAVPDAFVFTTAERKIVSINPAAEKLFGYQIEELSGKTTEIFYANSADYNDQGSQRFNKDANPSLNPYYINYRHKNGSEFKGETLGAKVVDHDGKILGFIGILRDVTERLALEEELYQHKENLEKMVQERTLALEHSNKELESYSYSIAHDLRSPLRSIIGFSQILLDDSAEKLDSEETEHLSRIVKSAKHMAELIDDILELSRMSRSKMQLDKVDLSNICLEASKSLDETDTDRSVVWRIQPDITATGDRSLLRVVMNNLIGNAWKFTQNKSQTLIEFGQMKEDGQNIYYVRDNGAGFDMKYVDKVFDLFQRLHRADEYEGTGVGLATVQRIIQRHNGWVKAEGEKGVGATVYFSIPELS
jgi:PAS domain S-box-containing protein